MEFRSNSAKLPLFTLPPHTNVLSRRRTCLQTTRPCQSPPRLIPTCSLHQDKASTVAISRRAFSTLLAGLPFLTMVSESQAVSDIAALVTPYKDLPKGFTILRPNGWNEFEGAQDAYDIKWQDVIQPLEFITVLTSPVGKGKTVLDIGDIAAVGKKLAKGRGGQLVNAAEKDIDGVPAYLFEIKKGPAHQLTLLAVNKQKLYSVNASCEEKRWGRREKLLRGVIDSFKPKL